MERDFDFMNKELLEENFSNFRLFGIGKETEAQKKRRAKVKKAFQDAGKNIKQTTKDAGKNIKQTTKEIKENKNLKKGLKNVFLTYNPAIAIPRSSALLAFRVNLFGISSRLYPAFLDEESLIKYNFNLENAKNAKKAWETVANFWEDKIGGDRNKLKEAISGAWNKPVFKTKKSQARKRSTSGYYGEEDYSNYTDGGASAIAGYISAGLSVVGGIVKIISDKGAKKNPYNEGSPEAQSFENQMAGEVPPTINQEQLNAIIASAQSDKAKGLPKDDTGIDLSDANSDNDTSSDDKILGMPKTAFWIGVGAIVLIGGYFGYKKFIAKK
jgi:hypothetical protein